MASFTFEKLNFASGGGIGSYIIDNFSVGDARGGFTKCFEQKIYRANGIPFHVTETLLTVSAKNVIRGIHFQLHEPQAKLVSVPYGKVCDVIVDLRADSATFRKWYAVELSGENHRALYVPRGFGNGVASLQDGTMVLCQCDGAYDQASDTGVRFDDPELGIEWPIDPSAAIHSARDLSLMTLAEYMRDPMR